MEELSDLHQKGNTIIMVTHNPRLTSYASRVITMLDGKIDSDTSLLPPEPPKVTPKRPLNTTKKKPAKKKAVAKPKKAATTKKAKK
jgi:ABC-type lipoprotein export system ATPase subunit